MGRLKRWAREIFILLCIVTVIVLVMDVLRAPQAPSAFETHRLETIDGEPVSLAERSQHKPLLLYFWASWCGVCRYTTPSVAALTAEGGNVLSVALRSGDDGQVADWLAAKRLTIPVINDPRGSLAEQWQVGLTPTFVVISHGKVVQSTTGWTSYWGMKLRLWWAALRHQ